MTSRRNDRARLTGLARSFLGTASTGEDHVGGKAADSALEADPAWLALHAERETLERALSLAQARQKFSTDPKTAADARREEAELLVSLDRVLTLIRAAEYRRRPGARRW
jgi:hypothetical protein